MSALEIIVFMAFGIAIYVAFCDLFDLPYHPGKLYRNEEHQTRAETRRARYLKARAEYRKNRP